MLNIRIIQATQQQVFACKMNAGHALLPQRAGVSGSRERVHVLFHSLLVLPPALFSLLAIAQPFRRPRLARCIFSASPAISHLLRPARYQRDLHIRPTRTKRGDRHLPIVGAAEQKREQAVDFRSVEGLVHGLADVENDVLDTRQGEEEVRALPRATRGVVACAVVRFGAGQIFEPLELHIGVLLAVEIDAVLQTDRNASKEALVPVRQALEEGIGLPGLTRTNSFD